MKIPPRWKIRPHRVSAQTVGRKSALLSFPVCFSVVDKNLRYFFERYQIPATQVVDNLKKEQTVEGIHMRNAESFLGELFL